jgi:hypothetical protein
MKTCKKCKIEKEISLFSKNCRMEDGLSKTCRECTKDWKGPKGKRINPHAKEKVCTKCNSMKNMEEFNKDRSRPDGHHPWCRECSSTIRKPYFDSRKQIKNEYDKEWYLKNQTRERKRGRENYEKNKKQIFAKTLARTKSDINFKMKGVLRKRIAKIINGHTKGGSAVKDLGCTVDFFVKYIESLWKSEMNWKNYGSGYGKWQIDHIKPLLNFDLSYRDQFLEACHYTNLQPLWYEDHIIKTREDLKK